DKIFVKCLVLCRRVGDSKRCHAGKAELARRFFDLHKVIFSELSDIFLSSQALSTSAEKPDGENEQMS
ncbi:MAG TPA: hypothetical protein PKC74_05365, partial [Turneriella sp.]|nr:hypothetical protein [Turneriella sp.]